MTGESGRGVAPATKARELFGAGTTRRHPIWRTEYGHSNICVLGVFYKAK